MMPNVHTYNVLQACVSILSMTFTEMKISFVSVTLCYFCEPIKTIEPKQIVNACF